jgi:hypothetical protein
MAQRAQPQIVAQQNIPAARALEVFKLLTKTAKGRAAFKASPSKAFNEHKKTLKGRHANLRSARYTAIPENSRKALAALSVYELELLSNLDATFVEDGLYVDVPSPGPLHYH